MAAKDKDHDKAPEPTDAEVREAERVSGNLPPSDPRRQDAERNAAQGNMATFGGTQGKERPDDSDTTSLSELDGAGGVALPPGDPALPDEQRGPVKVVPKQDDAPQTEVVEKIDFTPVTMDVEPDEPNGTYRTVIVQGTAVKVAAGKGVTVPLTVAEILGNAAQAHRTEQIRQGGVPPVLDLTSQPG